jgi:signal transduction histidine kinase
VTIEIIKPKEMVIETALCKDQLLVKGDPYQTNQIFLNIAKNAFDAMRERGQALRITTKRVESGRLGDYEEMDWVYCQQEKEWEKIKSASTHFALVGFEDQGVGMSQTLLKEIFHPFFTTKERGQGTGLGLSICRDITLRHGGNLTVKSEIDKGTTFEFLLPMTTED